MTADSGIERAKELLKTVRHAAMATVNADGSPHNTPFLFMHDQNLTNVIWGSHPDSQHSQNVSRTGQIFVVLYDATERGGLYIQAVNGHMLEGTELEEALQIHNELRAKEGKPALTLEYYQGDSPQRMWSATINKLWVNLVERDAAGQVAKDYRQEIQAADLLG